MLSARHQKPSSNLGLVLNSLGSFLDCLSIAEVTTKFERFDGEVRGDRIEIFVKLVDQWRPGWDLQAWDDIIWDVLDVFHDGPDRVTVGGHENCFACLQRWNDVLLPVRH